MSFTIRAFPTFADGKNEWVFGAQSLLDMIHGLSPHILKNPDLSRAVVESMRVTYFSNDRFEPLAVRPKHGDKLDMLVGTHYVSGLDGRSFVALEVLPGRAGHPLTPKEPLKTMLDPTELKHKIEELIKSLEQPETPEGEKGVYHIDITNPLYLAQEAKGDVFSEHSVKKATTKKSTFEDKSELSDIVGRHITKQAVVDLNKGLVLELVPLMPEEKPSGKVELSLEITLGFVERPDTKKQ